MRHSAGPVRCACRWHGRSTTISRFHGICANAHAVQIEAHQFELSAGKTAIGGLSDICGSLAREACSALRVRGAFCDIELAKPEIVSRDFKTGAPTRQVAKYGIASSLTPQPQVFGPAFGPTGNFAGGRWCALASRGRFAGYAHPTHLGVRRHCEADRRRHSQHRKSASHFRSSFPRRAFIRTSKANTTGTYARAGPPNAVMMRLAQSAERPNCHGEQARSQDRLDHGRRTRHWSRRSGIVHWAEGDAPDRNRSRRDQAGRIALRDGAATRRDRSRRHLRHRGESVRSPIFCSTAPAWCRTGQCSTAPTRNGRRRLDVNVTSMARMIRAFLPGMIDMGALENNLIKQTEAPLQHPSAGRQDLSLCGS